MKIAVAPNAFKGSLTAGEATQAIINGLTRSSLQCETVKMPLADGGDGTLEVLCDQIRTITVENPLGEPIEASYGVLPNGKTAIIEMALASGLALIPNRLDVMNASSFGTGQLMRHAIENGAEKLIVGVGGSATNDGGAGCLQALGVKLLTANRSDLPRGGGQLNHLVHVQRSPILDGIDVLVLCDVDTPPLGDNGASAIFGPQKGATPEMVDILDHNLAHYFDVIATQTGNDVRQLVGGGAAGAIAGGLSALANATLVGGAKTIIREAGYLEQLQQCDLVITGEGRIDGQSERGKAPYVMASLAKEFGIPTIAIGGSVEYSSTLPFTALFSLIPEPTHLDEAIAHASEWLELTAQQIGNILSIVNLNFENNVG